jgi:hypothetical protein
VVVCQALRLKWLQWVLAVRLRPGRCRQQVGSKKKQQQPPSSSAAAAGPGTAQHGAAQPAQDASCPARREETAQHSTAAGAHGQGMGVVSPDATFRKLNTGLARFPLTSTLSISTPLQHRHKAARETGSRAANQAKEWNTRKLVDVSGHAAWAAHARDVERLAVRYSARGCS